MARVRKYVWRILLLGLGLIVSLALIGVFSARAARSAPNRLVDEPIHPWMSLPYVAHSYRVPAYVLFEALGIPHLAHDRRPIVRIAHELNMPVDLVIAKLHEAIIHSRPPYPTPPPLPSSTPTSPAYNSPGSP